MLLTDKQLDAEMMRLDDIFLLKLIVIEKEKLTLRAAFLNLFIALNCLSLFKTALSRGVSGASPSSLIHG